MFSSGTIPLIAETMNLSLSSTVNFDKAFFRNADGMAKMIISESLTI